MKRDIQAKNYEATKNMTSEEQLEHIRQGAERFREEGRRKEKMCANEET
jgi:hypothetical protein